MDDWAGERAFVEADQEAEEEILKEATGEAEGAGATSLRIYLHVDSDEHAAETAEVIADLLAERGFNAEENLTAVIACIPDAEDVRAWASGPDGFVEAMGDAAFLLLPSADEGGEG